MTHSIAAAKYVSFTTFKKSGEPVATPVWIAPTVPGLGQSGDLVFVTELDTWKVKRLRRDPRVELRECDARGRVAPGAAVVHGTAWVATGPEQVRLTKDAIGAKYGLLYRVFAVAERLVLRHLPGHSERAGIVVTLGP